MYLLKFSTGQFVRGAIMQATNHTKGNFSRGQFPEGYCLGTIIFAVIFQEKQSGSNYSGGKYLGGGRFSSGAIILEGQLSGGNYLRKQLSGEIIRGATSPGSNCPGGNNPSGAIVQTPSKPLQKHVFNNTVVTFSQLL